MFGDMGHKIRPPKLLPLSTRRHRLCSDSEQVQRKAEGLGTFSRWEGPWVGGRELVWVAQASQQEIQATVGNGASSISALDLTGNLLGALQH